MAKHSTRPTDAEQRELPEAASLRSDLRERRQRIIDAAERLMFDVDYDKIQVKDVADAAGVALGTLYRYFNSKDHLFACALQSWSRSFGARLSRSPTGTPAERVKATYGLAVRAFERQPRVYNVLIQVQTSPDPHATAVFGEFGAAMGAVFVDALATSRLSARKREDVTAVMGAVLNENLRTWTQGRQSIESVHLAIDRAVDLIF
jgi:AcrR family transcriptional regulator